MHKTLTIVVVIALTLLFAASALGEVGTMKKGSWYLGGGLSAGFAKNGGDLYKVGDKSPSTIYFHPSVGYFFMDGLAVGALLGFENYTFGDNKSTSFGFGPKLYYYFGAAANDIVKGKMVPYATGSFTFNSNKTETPGATETVTSKSSGSNIHLGLGGIYMFANSFGVFGEAYYEMQKAKQKEPVEGESVSGSEFGVMIGVNAFFSLGD